LIENSAASLIKNHRGYYILATRQTAYPPSWRWRIIQPHGAFVWRGRHHSRTAGRSGHYRAALGRMERLRHRRALLDGNGRKLRRPTGNIQFSNYQEDGGIGYRQHCADQIAGVVIHCSPHTEIQIGFRKQNVDAANKVPGI